MNTIVIYLILNYKWTLIGPGQVQLRGSLTIAACRTSKVRQELEEKVFQ